MSDEVFRAELEGITVKAFDDTGQVVPEAAREVLKELNALGDSLGDDWRKKLLVSGYGEMVATALGAVERID